MGQRTDEKAVMLGRLVHQRWRIMSFEHDQFLESREGLVRLERLSYLLCLSSRQIRRWIREGKITTVEGIWTYGEKHQEMPMVDRSEVLRLLDEQIGFLEVEGHCRVNLEGTTWWDGRAVTAAKAARLLDGHPP